jgi:hypothetical protein
MIKLLKRFAKKIEKLNGHPEEKYDGIQEYRHDTPSGCERWFMKYSTKEEIAIKEIKTMVNFKKGKNENNLF